MLCRPCQQQKDRLEHEERSRHKSKYAEYFKLVKWKGALVGIKTKGKVPAGADISVAYLDDSGDGILVACAHSGTTPPKTVSFHYLDGVTDCKGLPKEKLIDLDRWCDDLSVVSVKALKAKVRAVIPTARLKVTQVEK